MYMCVSLFMYVCAPYVFISVWTTVWIFECTVYMSMYMTMLTHSFSVVGPKTWKGLPVDLRHLPNGACSQFHNLLKTVFFAWPGSGAPLSRYLEGALYKF